MTHWPGMMKVITPLFTLIPPLLLPEITVKLEEDDTAAVYAELIACGLDGVDEKTSVTVMVRSGGGT